jgi:hypothetical protein
MRPADLKKIHTKVLLNALRSARAHEDNQERIVNEIMFNRGYKISWNEKKGRDWIKLTLRPDKDIIVELMNDRYIGESAITVADLKAELDTREHIPNKIEAKAIRQEKARAKKNR